MTRYEAVELIKYMRSKVRFKLMCMSVGVFFLCSCLLLLVFQVAGIPSYVFRST